MNPWAVRVGHGWAEHRPPEVEEAHQLLACDPAVGRLAALSAYADRHLDGPVSLLDMPVYAADRPVEILGRSAHAVSAFLAALDDDRADVVSLIVINFQPRISPFPPRPDPFALACATMAEGLGYFFEAVAGSFLPGVEWSLCEWVLLTCSRVPIAD